MLLSFSCEKIDGIMHFSDEEIQKIGELMDRLRKNGIVRSMSRHIYNLLVYLFRDCPMKQKAKTTILKSPNHKNYDKIGDTFRLDSLDINIIKELLTDSNIKTADIAARYKIPLSTVQRRRARIENFILEKKYHLDINKRDWRRGMILANVTEGKAKEVAKMILERYKDNVISSSTRINDQNNVIAEVIYNDPYDLHNVIEQIKGNPYVSAVTWSELVEVVGNNNAPLIRVLSK
jgi:DNA-binding Lrp family transcriptional regulator